jgi:hypothetical protein
MDSISLEMPQLLAICFIGCFSLALLLLFAFGKPSRKPDPDREQKARSRRVMADPALQARSARAGRDWIWRERRLSNAPSLFLSMAANRGESDGQHNLDSADRGDFIPHRSVRHDSAPPQARQIKSGSADNLILALDGATKDPRRLIRPRVGTRGPTRYWL